MRKIVAYALVVLALTAADLPSASGESYNIVDPSLGLNKVAARRLSVSHMEEAKAGASDAKLARLCG